MKKIVLPEIISAGIYNAQIAIKNRSVSKNRKTTMFEIELPIETGGVSYIDERAHMITEDVLIVAKPGQTRHTRLPFKCYYIHIILNEGYLFDILSLLPPFISLRSHLEIREIFVSICEHYASGTAKDHLMIQSLILKLIYTAEREANAAEDNYVPKPNNSAAIEQTVAYIKGHLTEDLSLSALSEKHNFSPIYFHKLFKVSTGKNLRDYIEEQRITKAIELLISTEKTLTEIAYECGFSSQSYFSFAFKRRMGKAPREYARLLQTKYETPAEP